jgi:hypothetical protein
VRSVGAHLDAGEPPALHMLQSLPTRKLSTILELLDTNEAERLHMERGQLAQYRSHSGFVGAMPCIALRSITASRATHGVAPTNNAR